MPKTSDNMLFANAKLIETIILLLLVACKSQLVLTFVYKINGFVYEDIILGIEI